MAYPRWVHIELVFAIFVLPSDKVSYMFRSVIKYKSADNAASRRHFNAHREPLPPRSCAPLHLAGGVSLKTLNIIILS